ncbi:MAG: TetR/AcrR family transcriptional regulator [Cyanobacteria bacterium P01_F01_bin.86]
MPRKSAATDKPLREHILEVADTLFYTQGIHAVGIDRVIAVAGIAKTSLYRYFPSKDALVKAYLEQRDERFWRELEAALADCDTDPRSQLLGIIDWIAQLLARPTCYGCPFLLTVGEFPEPQHLARPVIMRHKQQLRDRLENLAQTAQLQHPQILGMRLLMLTDGAFAERRYLEPTMVSRVFKEAATDLVASFCH